MVSYYPAKLCGHGQSGRGDIMVPVCHVTLRYQVIKVLTDFMDRNLSRQVIIPSSFVAMGIMVVEIL